MASPPAAATTAPSRSTSLPSRGSTTRSGTGLPHVLARPTSARPRVELRSRTSSTAPPSKPPPMPPPTPPPMPPSTPTPMPPTTPPPMPPSTPTPMPPTTPPPTPPSTPPPMPPTTPPPVPPTTPPPVPPPMPPSKPSEQKEQHAATSARERTRSAQHPLARALSSLFSPLPANWHCAYDAHGEPYYWNDLSHAVTRDVPAALPHGWSLARDPATGSLYVWNLYTRQTAPYEPLRLQLGLPLPRPMGPPPDSAPPQATQPSLNAQQGCAPPKTMKELDESADTLMCGWSELMAEGEDAATAHGQNKYFSLSKDAQLRWFDCAHGEHSCDALYLEDTIDLQKEKISAITREHPDSKKDFTFNIVLQKRKVVINPGSKTTFRSWEEGLLSAMSAPCNAVRSALRMESSRRSSRASQREIESN